MRRRSLLRAAAPALFLAGVAACGNDSSTSGPDANGSDAGGPDGDGDTSDGGGASDGGGDSDPADDLPDPVDVLTDALSTREAAGQLVLVGVQAGGEVDPTLVTEQHVGGFFLLGQWESAEAVRSVVGQASDAAATAAEESDADAAIEEAYADASPDPDDVPTIAQATAPLMCVDQEGGQIRVLRPDAARETPSAEQLAADGEQATTEAYGTIGEDLADLGLHANLAPVADVVDPELGTDNAPVGAIDRGFGTDPEQVGTHVVAATEALHEHGIAATLKHFPGLGRVRENTDFSAEDITDETTSADDPFLQPFRDGIDAGAEMVMVSSAVYPRIDPDGPAMFSSAVITDLLRDDLGFDGLVITDDIGAAAAVQDVPVAQRVTRLLEAGGDAVLTADPALAAELVDAIEQWAQEDDGHATRLRASCARMLRIKREVIPAAE